MTAPRHLGSEAISLDVALINRPSSDRPKSHGVIAMCGRCGYKFKAAETNPSECPEMRDDCPIYASNIRSIA